MMLLVMIVPFVFFAIVFALACREWARQLHRFHEKFPPITDEEFVALCRPGVNPAVALKVRRIVADNLGIEYTLIHPSASFVEDLGAD